MDLIVTFWHDYWPYLVGATATFITLALISILATRDR